jgi:hypothetical protein
MSARTRFPFRTRTNKAAVAAAVTGLALTLTLPARAGFLTAEQWLGLNAEQQAAYVAGAYDSLVTYVTNTAEMEAIGHYQSCVAHAKLTPVTMATGLKDELGANPKLAAESAPGAFLKYLVKLCGEARPK